MHEMRIKGEPVAKGRPKFSSRGKFVKVYTPKKTLDAEKKIRDQYIAENLPKIEKGIPVKVWITFSFAMPSSWSNKKKVANFGKPKVTRPDVDNLAKLVVDALNGVAFHDDSQIVEMVLRKEYAYVSFAYLWIEEIGNV